MQRLIVGLSFSLQVACAAAAPPPADALEAALEVLRAAPQGAGPQSAQAAAWRVAAAVDSERLPQILAAMNDAGPVGENWLRSAADAVAERQQSTPEGLSAALLESFVLDRAQPPRGRSAAYEWLKRVDPEAPNRLLPEMLADSSLELRHDAIERLIDQAQSSGDAERQEQRYQRAFQQARDVGQIEKVARALRELGKPPDLIGQMGFVTHWQIIGPFDNSDLAGFDTAYPPESELDFTAEYAGKSRRVTWQSYAGEDEMGSVDLNGVLGDDKEVVAYAAAVIDSPREAPLQIRLGSKNAPKAWFNGQPIGSFEVYHAGFAIDQYVMPVKFRQGRNVILLKVCQNSKDKSWEAEWEFQLRITDALGGAADVRQQQFREASP